MFELTRLESKLGEVAGLAMAAQVATEQVLRLTASRDDELVSSLRRMHEESAETEERCAEVAESFAGGRAAILEVAGIARDRALVLMGECLPSDAAALDGFEFLTMAAAGQVVRWSVLATLNAQVDDEDVGALVAWALPMQQRHLAEALRGAVELAGDEEAR